MKKKKKQRTGQTSIQTSDTVTTRFCSHSWRVMIEIDKNLTHWVQIWKQG